MMCIQCKSEKNIERGQVCNTCRSRNSRMQHTGATQAQHGHATQPDATQNATQAVPPTYSALQLPTLVDAGSRGNVHNLPAHLMTGWLFGAYRDSYWYEWC